MSDTGTVKVLVRSKRVPVGVASVSTPRYVGGVKVESTPTKVVVYEDILDEGNMRAVRDGERIADQMCLDLEVVDRSKSGVFGRAVASLWHGQPKLVITPSIKQTNAYFGLGERTSTGGALLTVKRLVQGP